MFQGKTLSLICSVFQWLKDNEKDKCNKVIRTPTRPAVKHPSDPSWFHDFDTKLAEDKENQDKERRNLKRRRLENRLESTRHMKVKHYVIFT